MVTWKVINKFYDITHIIENDINIYYLPLTHKNLNKYSSVSINIFPTI